MKFKAGDTVLVTGGKDKGKQGKIVKVIPERNVVVVEGANMYTKHVKPMQGRPGEKVRRERPMNAGKVAIYNADTKAVDRIGYKVEKDGTKTRIFKKTGKAI